MDTTFVCKKCGNEIFIEDVDFGIHRICGGIVIEVCGECLGTGQVVVMEQVYQGEPHEAPIGLRPCLCKKQLHDGDGDDD